MGKVKKGDGMRWLWGRASAPHQASPFSRGGLSTAGSSSSQRRPHSNAGQDGMHSCKVAPHQLPKAQLCLAGPQGSQQGSRGGLGAAIHQPLCKEQLSASPGRQRVCCIKGARRNGLQHCCNAGIHAPQQVAVAAASGHTGALHAQHWRGVLIQLVDAAITLHMPVIYSLDAC
jgi:hypothetical protein